MRHRYEILVARHGKDKFMNQKKKLWFPPYMRIQKSWRPVRYRPPINEFWVHCHLLWNYKKGDLSLDDKLSDLLPISDSGNITVNAITVAGLQPMDSVLSSTLDSLTFWRPSNSYYILKRCTNQFFFFDFRSRPVTPKVTILTRHYMTHKNRVKIAHKMVIRYSGLPLSIEKYSHWERKGVGPEHLTQGNRFYGPWDELYGLPATIAMTKSQIVPYRNDSSFSINWFRTCPWQGGNHF
jgi:hypothetical protein